jgi:N-carbamoylputrescine amidase
MDVLRVAAVTDTAPLGNSTDGLARVRRWVQAARHRRADVVLFPELYLTGYAPHHPERLGATPVPGPLSLSLQRMADDTRMMLLVGLAELDPSGRRYASQLVVRPGLPLDRYRKVHLAPPEQGLFTPAESFSVFEHGAWRFGIQLCYDSHFPELSTCMALGGAEVLFMPHASPRGTSREKYRSWCRHLTARAYDNALFVVACNQAGDNGAGLTFPAIVLAIGPDGTELAAYLESAPGMVMVELTRAALTRVRTHRMRFFLPRRRPELYHAIVAAPSVRETPTAIQ